MKKRAEIEFGSVPTVKHPSAPAGPFKILDIVGLETAYNINLMNPKTKEEGSVNYKIDKLLKEKIDKGETGVNAGKGFYDYKK